MTPGSRTKHTLKPGENFQVFRGEVELDVFYDDGEWKIITTKEVIHLQEKQTGKPNSIANERKPVSGMG